MIEQQTDNMKKTGSLRNEIRTYIEKRLELLNLTVAEEISLLITDGIQIIIGLLLLSGALLFTWLAFAFLLSDWVDSYSGGFALASVPLFLLTLLFMKKRSVILTEKIQEELMEKAIFKFDENGMKRPTTKKENEQ